MLERRGSAAALAAVVGLALVGTGRADDGAALARWLESLTATVRRDRQDLVDWRRRRPNLVAEALAVAQDARRSPAARGGALRVLAAAADEVDSARALRSLADTLAGRDLAALAGEAAERAARRAALLAKLRAGADPPVLAADDLAALSQLASDPLLAGPPRLAAIRWVGRAGSIEEVGLLARLVLRADEPPAVRSAALDALVRRGEHRQVGGLLGRLLARSQPAAAALRDRALEALAAAGRLGKAARRLLHGDDLTPAAAAALAPLLAAREVPDVVAALRRAEARSRDALTLGQRCAIVAACLELGAAPERADAVALVGGASSSDPRLRRLAAGALARHRPPGLEDALHEAFRATDPGERRLRVIHLAEVLELRGMVETLGAAVGDRGLPLAVRQAGLHALGALGGPRAAAFLLEVLRLPAQGAGQALRREAADALGACGPSEPARGALGAALRDPEPTVRRAALRALVAWGDAGSAAAVRAFLLRAAAPTDAAEWVARLEACLQLDLRDPAAAAAVLDLPADALKVPEVAAAALSFARRLGRDEAVPALLRLLDHRDTRLADGARLELTRRYPPGRSFGDPLAAGAAGRRAVARWREAWASQPERFR